MLVTALDDAGHVQDCARPLLSSTLRYYFHYYYFHVAQLDYNHCSRIGQLYLCDAGLSTNTSPKIAPAQRVARRTVVRLHRPPCPRAAARHEQFQSTDKRFRWASPGVHALTGHPATFLMSHLRTEAQRPLPRAASRALTMSGISRRYVFHTMLHVPGLGPSPWLCATLPSLSRRPQSEHHITKSV